MLLCRGERYTCMAMGRWDLSARSLKIDRMLLKDPVQTSHQRMSRTKTDGHMVLEPAMEEVRVFDPLYRLCHRLVLVHATTVRWWTTRDDFRMIKRVSNFWRSCKLIIEMNRLWEDDAFTKISQDTRYKNVPRELTDFLTRKEGAYSDLTRISVVLTKQSSFVNLDQSIRAPENMKAT
jgi:hypothetical protein